MQTLAIFVLASLPAQDVRPPQPFPLYGQRGAGAKATAGRPVLPLRPGPIPTALPKGVTLPRKSLLPIQASALGAVEWVRTVAFDPHTVRAHWVNGRWELRAGQTWIKDFGTRGSDAREAERIIRRLELTEYVTIGRPAPIVEFWLSRGNAPKALRSGLRVTPIDRDSLRIEKIQDNWCIRDDRRVLFNFGVDRPAAHRTLEAIERYQFTHVGGVGFPRPSMMYFVSADRSLQPRSIRPASLGVKSIAEKTAARPGEFKTGSIKTLARNPAFDENVLLRYQAYQLARGTRQLAPPPAATTTYVRIDPRELTLRRGQNGWRLFAGNLYLAEFGQEYHLARKAVTTLQGYHCDTICYVGLPETGFFYFLSRGHAPRGFRYDVSDIRFNPYDVEAKQVGKDGWCVCEKDRPLFRFGPHEAAARELATAIRRYQFDRIATFGERFPLLVRSR